MFCILFAVKYSLKRSTKQISILIYDTCLIFILPVFNWRLMLIIPYTFSKQNVNTYILYDNYMYHVHSIGSPRRADWSIGCNCHAQLLTSFKQLILRPVDVTFNLIKHFLMESTPMTWTFVLLEKYSSK